MYYIIGADGKEQGPVALEQMRGWILDGRINSQSKVRVQGSDRWVTAAEVPELNQALQTANPQASGAPVQAGAPKKGLAITSLILGILSMICLGPLAAIPAVIFGHKARSKARQFPGAYTGAGMATVGLVLGYISLALFVIALAVFLPRVGDMRAKAQVASCQSNMKEIGLALSTWEIEHGQFPFHVSTEEGGTLEHVAPGPDGVDPNGYLHLKAMAEQLGTPRVLVCPGDNKRPARDFESLTAENVSYQVMTGENVTSADPSAVVARCPIHRHVLTSNGAVQSTDQTDEPAQN
jgi:hypothetical protein